MDTIINIVRLLKYYNTIKHNSIYASRYSDELNMHNLSNVINFYRDSNNKNESYDNCVLNMQTMQEYDKYVDIDKKYTFIKALGGGKSGAYVFLVKNDNKTCVLKLYALRLKNPKNLVDRDLREIFISCNFSDTQGFPNVINYGYTYFNRESKFWEPFVNSLCPNNVINFGLYNKCYFLVTDFVKGQQLDKINLINMSSKKLVNVLLSLKKLFVTASKKIPNFVHRDLHPGNVIIDDEIVTIIDFDIASSPYYKYNLDSFRSSTGYILPQEAILDMLINYVGIVNALLIVELTEPYGLTVSPDFRIWLIYKILFEIVMLYKITNKINNVENLGINPSDSYIINIILNKYIQNKNNCSSFESCDDEYFNFLNLSDIEFVDKISEYFGKYKNLTNLDYDNKKISSLMINKILINAFTYYHTEIQKCDDCFNMENIKKIIDNIHYKKITNYFDNFVNSYIKLSDRYYEKTGKYMKFSDCVISLFFKFDNFKIPIHTNNNTTYLMLDNNVVNNNDDGILIDITNDTIIITNKNTDIKIDNLLNIPLSSLFNKVFNNVIQNIEKIEYNYKKKTIKIKSINNISLTKILEKYSNSEKGIKKIHKILERLECNEPFDFIDFFNKTGFNVIPFIMYIIQNIPTGYIGIKSKYDNSISEKVNITLNYEKINELLKNLDNILYSHYDDIIKTGIKYKQVIQNHVKNQFKNTKKHIKQQTNKNQNINQTYKNINITNDQVNNNQINNNQINNNQINNNQINNNQINNNQINNNQNNDNQINNNQDTNILKGGNTTYANKNFYNEDEEVIDLVYFMNKNIETIINNTKNKVENNRLHNIGLSSDEFNDTITLYKNTLKPLELFECYDKIVQDTQYYNNYFYDLFNRTYGKTLSYKTSYLETEKIFKKLNRKNKNTDNNNSKNNNNNNNKNNNNEYKYKFINEEHDRYLKKIFTDIMKNRSDDLKKNIKNIIKNNDDDFGLIIMEYFDNKN